MLRNVLKKLSSDKKDMVLEEPYCIEFESNVISIEPICIAELLWLLGVGKKRLCRLTDVTGANFLKL